MLNRRGLHTKLQLFYCPQNIKEDNLKVSDGNKCTYGPVFKTCIKKAKILESYRDVRFKTNKSKKYTRLCLQRKQSYRNVAQLCITPRCVMYIQYTLRRQFIRYTKLKLEAKKLHPS